MMEVEHKEEVVHKRENKEEFQLVGVINYVLNSTCLRKRRIRNNSITYFKVNSQFEEKINR